MHAEARAFQARIRSEFNDPNLVCIWDEVMERYRIGQKVRVGASDTVDYFYTVTDGNNGFKPLDQRTIRKLHSLDKAKVRVPTADEIRAQLRDAKEKKDADERASLAYKFKHEAKFIGGRFGFRR